MLHRTRHAGIIFHRPDALVEVHQLSQRHIQAANSTAYRRSQRPLDRHSKVHRRLDRIFRQPVLRLPVALLSGQHLKPLDLALAAISLLNGRIKHPLRSLPDVPARSIALDKRNNRPVRHRVLAVCVLNRLTIRGDRNTVIYRLHGRHLHNFEVTQTYHPKITTDNPGDR